MQNCRNLSCDICAPCYCTIWTSVFSASVVIFAKESHICHKISLPIDKCTMSAWNMHRKWLLTFHSVLFFLCLIFYVGTLVSGWQISSVFQTVIVWNLGLLKWWACLKGNAGIWNKHIWWLNLCTCRARDHKSKSIFRYRKSTHVLMLQNTTPGSLHGKSQVCHSFSENVFRKQFWKPQTCQKRSGV